MFLLSFALSIAIYTIWLNAKLGILISLVMMVGLMVGMGCWIGLRYGKSNNGGQKKPSLYWQWGKNGLYIFIGNFLALLVVCGSLRFKGSDMLKLFFSPSKSCTEITCTAASEWQIFNGFGMIIDTQKYHVYLFEDAKGNVWRLSSNQSYHIGDQLFLSASVKALDTKIIFDSTFFPPRKAAFRDYQFNYDKWIFMKGIDGTAYEKQTLLVDPEKP
ncbi:MAG: hypothetical protein LBD75_08025 [Candidatus Peribacteria bacterium]|jgi:hypothetical protein|nr:hypothetical protein [Candidatus Peribacteria bacterium]